MKTHCSNLLLQKHNWPTPPAAISLAPRVHSKAMLSASTVPSQWLSKAVIPPPVQSLEVWDPANKQLWLKGSLPARPNISWNTFFLFSFVGVKPVRRSEDPSTFSDFFSFFFQGISPNKSVTCLILSWHLLLRTLGKKQCFYLYYDSPKYKCYCPYFPDRKLRHRLVKSLSKSIQPVHGQSWGSNPCVSESRVCTLPLGYTRASPPFLWHTAVTVAVFRVWTLLILLPWSLAQTVSSNWNVLPSKGRFLLLFWVLAKGYALASLSRSFLSFSTSALVYFLYNTHFNIRLFPLLFCVVCLSVSAPRMQVPWYQVSCLSLSIALINPKTMSGT